MRNTRKKSDGGSLTYVERVNRALDFILLNLHQPLKLELIARVAGFSPFHFHRIFRLLIGESLKQFVKRVRLERSLALLSRRTWATRRRASLTDIAFACGFASSSDFCRSFKQCYGMPPSKFDVASFRTKRREEWQIAVTDPAHHYLLNRLRAGANPDAFCVRLRRQRQASNRHSRGRGDRQGRVQGVDPRGGEPEPIVGPRAKKIDALNFDGARQRGRSPAGQRWPSAEPE